MDGEVPLAAYITAAYLETGEMVNVSIQDFCCIPLRPKELLLWAEVEHCSQGGSYWGGGKAPTIPVQGCCWGRGEKFALPIGRTSLGGSSHGWGILGIALLGT